MRILIAGAGGFLGSHLTEALLEDQHEIIGLDNFFTGSKTNLSQVLGNPRFELIRHDVTFPIYLEVDAIFNLASPASPVHYKRDPVQTLKTNVVGSINLLGLAKRLQVPIIQASTSEVYGDPLQHPQRESYFGHVNPVGPRACYDEGKRAAETLFADYKRQFKVDTRVIRIFNTYGPRMAANDGRVISEFIVRALRNEPLQINGDGLQTRSFCYVTDLIRGLRCALETAADGPVNLGNPHEVTILDVAYMILEMTNSRSDLVLGGHSADDPHRRQPDIGKAQQEFGWEPIVSLEEGLRETIRFFEASL